MKLLENSEFEALSSALSFQTNVCEINCRIESYSCKMAGNFKRLYKHLNDEKSGQSPQDFQMLGPPQTTKLACSPIISSNILSTSLTTNLTTINNNNNNNNNNLTTNVNYMQSRSYSDDPDNPLDKIVSRKTLFYLIQTLNASYEPDYDFSNTASSEFSKEPSFDYIQKSIESYMKSYDVYLQLRQRLYDAIDKEIMVADPECEFYSYNPDLNAGDPCGEGLWFLNYFIYNKKLKRILFVTFRCISKSMNDDEDVDDLSIDNDENIEFMEDDNKRMIGLMD